MVADREALWWLQQGEERLRVFLALSQPLTASQMSARLGKPRSSVSEHLRQMQTYGVVRCLNEASRRSRVFGLTSSGGHCHATLADIYRQAAVATGAGVDWVTHGRLCFRHRGAVLLALRGRMRPTQIKKQALASDPCLRMSVDNCRQVLRWMVAQGVARATRARGKRFSYYMLTEVGVACREAMQTARAPS